MSNNNVPVFSEREVRLITSCKTHVANDLAGSPDLMIIIAKLSDLLIGNELVEARYSDVADKELVEEENG